MAYVLYALAIIVFCFFYTLFGAVLYVVGPLVLALIPISGVGQLGKTYAINVMIWNAWGILYAVFGALITAIQVNQVNDVLGNGFLGFLQGCTGLGHARLGEHLLRAGRCPDPVHRQADHFRRCGINGIRLGACGRGCRRRSPGRSQRVCRRSQSQTPCWRLRGGGAGAGGSSTRTSASSMPPPTPATSMASFLRSGIASA